jgi:hypothetical protein
MVTKSKRTYYQSPYNIIEIKQLPCYKGKKGSKDLLEMGDEAVNKYMRNTYPDLHVTTLLGARNPPFVGSPSKGTESVIRRFPQVPWETPHGHLCRYLGKVTRVTNSQSTSEGGGTVDSWDQTYGKDNKVRSSFKGMKTSGPIILMRTLNRFKIHEVLRPNEIVTLKKNSQYMLFPLLLVKLWRGDLCCSSTCDLVFIPCVRGGSQLFLYDSWIFSLFSVLQSCFNGLGEFTLHPITKALKS